MHRMRILKVAVPLFLILCDWVVAADGKKSTIKQLTSSVNGSTGLYTLPLADTLRRGEFVFAINSLLFHRDPGALSLTVFPVSFSIGVDDRIEFFASVESYKRIRARDVLVDKVSPEGELLPAVVASANDVGYFNDAPFVDVESGAGRGDFWAGVKLNLLSERRSRSFSLALQPIIRVHTARDRQHKLRGLTPGVIDAGIAVVVSKWLKKVGTITGKAGFRSGRDVAGVRRQDQAEWGVGIEWPVLKSSLRVVGELSGQVFLGPKEFDLTNPVSPIEALAGIRVKAGSWLTLSGALNLHLRNASDSRYNIVTSKGTGWIFQASFERKINRPPSVSCTVDKSKVREGETILIQAKTNDADDDSLWLSWKSNGGRLWPNNSSVMLDTTGVQPGRYSVLAEVGDGGTIASCSVDVEVENEGPVEPVQNEKR